MNVAWPLTVYYDGQCPLCVAEMSALKAHDPGDAFRLVDCSAPDFVDADVAAAGIERATLLRILHARDADGRWLSGVDVFVALYRHAGFHAIAGIWGHRRLKPLWDRLYPWIARYRMALSRLGLHHVYGWLVARAARRATARQCSGGRCSDG